MKKLACLFLILAASGCPDVKVDPDEIGPVLPQPGPTVEFDPSSKIVPFPNNLLLNPMTGKVTLPEQCGETATAKGLREGVLNKLDGFGLYEGALTVTFTEAVDMASLMGRVALYKRTSPEEAATAAPVPVKTELVTTARFDAGCASPPTLNIPQLVITPLVPLEQKSNYVVALLDGITTAKGDPFNASGTWLLVRSKRDPVGFVDGKVVYNDTPLDPSKPEDLERLKGIDLLWKAHAAALKFLADDLPADKQQPRDKILVAAEFKTQTSTDPLDPTVTGSPAAAVDRTKLNLNVSVTAVPTIFNRANPPFSACPVAETDVQCFIKISIGAGSYATGNATCAALGCAAIGDVLVSTLDSKQYQIDTPNPYTGTGAEPIPGPWGDPNAPTVVKSESINVFVTVPAAAAAAYPVVVFQHALGQSRTNLLAIAGQLSARGYAAVAIDAVGHDSRAVRVSTNAAIGCGDVAGRPDLGPSPVSFPQCYAPFLSPNLAATRDGIRQTVLDQQRLVAALKACGTTDCNALKVDVNHLLYMGQSLGGIVGSISTSLTQDFKAAVLNVPGVGWVDILENTGTLPIQCQLVDGLIDAGILVGAKSNLAVVPPTGLCTMPDDWKKQPGYRQFAVIGRWVLDPADPANFTSKLATKRFLIQQVDGDSVVPKDATKNQGAFVKLTQGMADPVTAPPPPLPAPSAVITTNPMSSKWVLYGGPAIPGFGHGSLLQPPAGSGVAGQLATLRMQVDALAYLALNNP